MDEREDASRSGGFEGSQDILCKTALSRSKVPFSQLSDPTPSPGGGSDDSQPASDSLSCFTQSAWSHISLGARPLGGGVQLSSRDA